MTQNEATAYQQLREELGLTQAQFAAELGLSHQRISQLETEGGALSPANLLPMVKRYKRQLKRLGLSIEDFLGGSR